jgi:hypothetical protein
LSLNAAQSNVRAGIVFGMISRLAESKRNQLATRRERARHP